MLSITKKVTIEIAKTTSEEIMLMNLERVLNEYIKDRNDYNKSKMKLYIGMLFIRYETEGQSVNKTINDLEKKQQAVDLLIPMDN